MRPWNKPIRMSKKEHIKALKEHDKRFNEDNRSYGITNWMVGTTEPPWIPWIQIHFGYFLIQIKWYLIVMFLMILSFMLGILL